MGIIGFGRIGLGDRKIAVLGMKVLAYDVLRMRRAADRNVCRIDTLLVIRCNIASLSAVPGDTREISRDTIARNGDGVIILNNSRGPLIAEQDALNCGKVCGGSGCREHRIYTR